MLGEHKNSKTFTILYPSLSLSFVGHEYSECWAINQRSTIYKLDRKVIVSTKRNVSLWNSRVSIQAYRYMYIKGSKASIIQLKLSVPRSYWFLFSFSFAFVNWIDFNRKFLCVCWLEILWRLIICEHQFIRRIIIK